MFLRPKNFIKCLLRRNFTRNYMTKRLMPKQIGTHDGTFHADEAFACYLLLQTDEFKDADIVRTRDEKVLATMDIVIDVGGVYDPSKHRYDHHQRGFAETLDSEHKIKLSSAGLIYKHFGLEIIKKLTSLDGEDAKTIYYKLYSNFVESLDGIDNGVSQFDTDTKPSYKINTHVSARVGRLNPHWNAESQETDGPFRKAVALIGQEFMEILDQYTKSWLPARSIVEQAVKEANTVDSSGEIIVLPRFCPWKSHLYDIEEERGEVGKYKFAIFNSGDW
eukprot:TRINITY_DN1502_c0_g1_i4.p1 TRINITY_DN1502_c0_g1~~TRINITY_DN1502_c0_g1_i4.p1  ORF type:complete len:277 (+),score=53.88 TRINITY_DN1502_c0_g1_i4:21-851(+)